MNKMKFGWLLTLALFATTLLRAQTIEEGRKFLYYEKFVSAKSVFEKLVAANPNNIDAVYWLGISMINLGEKDAAKSLFQKTLMANSNSALLMAGIGHVEILEGKTQDARARFEAAISISQGKNIPVLNAIGFANADYESKEGDAQFAVDKLKQATTIKGFKDPDVWVNLGDAYRKLGDGGNAQTSYESALTLDPKYARAPYRIGKIYQTQGFGQEEIYMKYFNQAIAIDPAYAPVYENLYNLYYSTNVTKSAEYLDLFLANTDDNPKNCYMKASMKYAQGLFTEAVSKADECIGTNASPYPKLYGIKGYAFNKLGDSLNAKAAFEKYLQVPDQSILGAGDYTTYASVLLKFPGSDSLAGIFIDKAVALEPLEANKVTFLKSMASFYETRKLSKSAADWYSKVIQVKKSPSKVDYYNAGYNYFRAGLYPTAISIFNTYGEKYPEDPFSFYMIGKANWGIDSTMAQGLANSAFEKTIQVGVVDSVKYKAQLIGSYKYFVAYYANIKKDNATAVNYCDRILWLEPNDAEAANYKKQLSAPSRPTPPAPPARSGNPPAKPATPKPAA